MYSVTCTGLKHIIQHTRFKNKIPMKDYYLYDKNEKNHKAHFDWIEASQVTEK